MAVKARRPVFRGGGGRFTVNPIQRGIMTDFLTPGIVTYGAVLSARVLEVMREYAREMEDYAKSNHPWSNRTGDAEAGLTTTVEENPFRPKIYLYHTVSYGLWLEVRFNGLYAVILPTIEDLGPGLIRRIEEVI